MPNAGLSVEEGSSNKVRAFFKIEALWDFSFNVSMCLFVSTFNASVTSSGTFIIWSEFKATAVKAVSRVLDSIFVAFTCFLTQIIIQLSAGCSDQ